MLHRQRPANLQLKWDFHDYCIYEHLVVEIAHFRFGPLQFLA